MTLSEFNAAYKSELGPWIAIWEDCGTFAAEIYTVEGEPPDYDAYGKTAIEALAALIDVIAALPMPMPEDVT